MQFRATAVLLSVLFAGCLWRGYARVLEIHLDVLQSMAAKMCALTRAPAPPSETMGEFVYPAKRAREVAGQFSSRVDMESYAGFNGVVDRYEALVRDFDRSRADPATWQQSGVRVCDESVTIATAARAVRNALADGR